MSQAESNAGFGQAAPVYCRGCGYSLVGLEGRVCPECGRGFDLGDPRTFWRRPGGWRRVAMVWVRRVLILGICFAVLAGGGLVWVWWGWRSEQPVIERLEKLNAQVDYKPVLGWPFGFLARARMGYIGRRVDLIELRPATPSGALAKVDLGSLHQLKSVICNEANLNHDDIAKLAEVKSMEVLIMDWVRIDDGELEKLSNLNQLWFLDIKGSNVTDDGAVYLKKLTKLRRLDIRFTAITDAGLANLRELNKLELLGAGGDGAGVGASAAGIAKLRKAMPNLKPNLKQAW